MEVVVGYRRAGARCLRLSRLFSGLAALEVNPKRVSHPGLESDKVATSLHSTAHSFQLTTVAGRVRNIESNLDGRDVCPERHEPLRGPIFR